jgi:VWFA-related protein
MRRTRESFATALLAVTLAVPGLAAQTAPPVQDSFGESIDVRVVNVEAVVTDRQGKRVPGLTAADFRLLVDGREVPIDYFTEVRSGEVAAPAPAPGAPGGETPAAAAPVGPGEKVGTNYLVFVDDQFAISAQRNLVLQRLAADLGRLGPQDRMAIVAFDGNHLERLSDWTADRQALAQAFAAAQNSPTFGIGMLAERRVEGGNLVIAETGSALVEQIRQMGIGIQAVVAAMRGTPAPAGRKVMILLNGGWGVPDVPQRRFGAPSAADLPQAENLFAPIFDTANLLGYTLYAVDVEGMDPDSTWADASATGPVDHTFITTGRERGVHAALEVVARETGGKAMLNSARLDAFARVAADTSSYYWLGFTPQWKADGKRHDVRLEARRTGLAVRSRTGFSDLSRAEEAQIQAASQLLYSGVPAGPLAVTVGATRRSGLTTMEMPLGVEIPVSALTPLPAEGGWNLAANVSIAVLEGRVESAKWRTVPVRIHATALPEAGGSLHWETLLKLHRSTRRLLVVLGGDHGEVLGRTEVAVRPPAGE